ncbi:MAG: carboxypeptidase regulatory-like domain-containing protein [Saprospiraceae bacterium]
MKYFFTITLLFAVFATTFSQNFKVTQTIRGTITDAVDGLPIEGATVFLLPSDIPFGAITDYNGDFRFDSIPVGRYQLKITYVGYKTMLLSEVLLESGKEAVKYIELEKGTESLEEVVVVAGRPKLNTLSVHTITPEQTQRFAATFYDPARLATSFAGVVSQNDGTNNLIIRGNSPTSTTWWLEGAEIVNPNHTANAGTFSDKIMPSGGGVNIMSAQLLGDSYFFKGNYPTQYGNGLGGILDMRLRPGNNENREYTAQIGLIGIDFAAEGPFNKEYAASYVVNYRYSTLGLLNQLGVPLGDEEVSFQDLSFNITLPTENLGTLTMFGMGGRSKNTFEAQRDSEIWEFQKDRQDIYFTSQMGAIGGTYNVPFADKAFWKSTFIISAMNANRDAFQLDSNYVRTTTNRDYRQEAKISFSTMLQVRFNEKLRLKTGLVGTQYIQDVRAADYLREDSVAINLEGFTQNWLFRPYSNLEFRPSTQLRFNFGMAYAYYAANETGSPEPLFSMDYDFKKNQTLSFSYRLQSQLQSPSVYFGANISSNTFFPEEVGAFGYNRKLEMSKAHHLGLAYNTNVLNQLNIHAEAYYQHLFDIPITINQNSTFSAINLLDEIIQDTLVSDGTGRNYGVELTVQKFMDEGYYLLLTSSLFESKYTAADGIERDARFNTNYGMVLSGGKEFQWQSFKGNQRIFGVNIKLVYLGGFRATPIDVPESSKNATTIFNENQAFSEQYPNYFRTDLRFYLKKNHKKYTSTLAIDIQNLTNHQNTAFDYFDTTQQEVIRKYQLGIIPILVYRFEF